MFKVRDRAALKENAGFTETGALSESGDTQATVSSLQHCSGFSGQFWSGACWDPCMLGALGNCLLLPNGKHATARRHKRNNRKPFLEKSSHAMKHHVYDVTNVYFVH